jgi:hypothetical protein
LQVEWSELVDADDHRWIIVTRLDVAIRDRVQLEDPVLLGFEVGIVGLFEGLDHVKRHALLTEQNLKALMADAVDTGVLRSQRVEPVSVEVVDHLPQLLTLPRGQVSHDDTLGHPPKENRPNGVTGGRGDPQTFPVTSTPPEISRQLPR